MSSPPYSRADLHLSILQVHAFLHHGFEPLSPAAELKERGARGGAPSGVPGQIEGSEMICIYIYIYTDKVQVVVYIYIYVCIDLGGVPSGVPYIYIYKYIYIYCDRGQK